MLGQMEPKINRVPLPLLEVISVAFAIDCHDREVPAFVASPRPLAGADVRTLMDRMLWARLGEATLNAPHAV